MNLMVFWLLIGVFLIIQIHVGSSKGTKKSKLLRNDKNKEKITDRYYDYYGEYYVYTYNGIIYHCNAIYCSFYSDEVGQPVKGKAEISAHPHVLQLGRNGEQYCGASIISDKWALTAAHCLFETVHEKKPVESLTLRAGASMLDEGGRLHKVAKTASHPLYIPGDLHHDVALIKVTEPFQFSYKVQPALLPLRRMSLRNRPLIVSSFGITSGERTSVDSLNVQKVKLVGPEECASQYKSSNIRITNSMFCGTPMLSSISHQVPGSSVTYNGTIIGVVIADPPRQASNMPTLYNSVANLMPWIQRMTEL